MGYHNWELDDFDNCADDEEFLIGTEITYECPPGYTFQMGEDHPDPITISLTLTCSKFSVWLPQVEPICVRKFVTIDIIKLIFLSYILISVVTCDGEPDEAAGNIYFGVYDWNTDESNRTFGSKVNYR